MELGGVRTDGARSVVARVLGVRCRTGQTRPRLAAEQPTGNEQATHLDEAEQPAQPAAGNGQVSHIDDSA